ncbi:SPFH domain-containing protein [Dactylosporangium sp. NPDC050688]|uniref:SPFH domain-containing protein n=1 Tax=Dactylosporangium sp. NPDC050688 TaxID=3157217 RepID=UPI0033ECA513
MDEFQTIAFVVLITIGVIGLVTASCAIRVLRPSERGVVFRLGRLHGDGRGPGPTLIVPGMDRLTRVDLKVTTVSAAARDVVTRDRVPVGVGAVICFRVVDPVKAVLNVRNYRHAVSEIAEALLRTAVSCASLDDLLSDRDDVTIDLTNAINAVTEGPWGVQAQRVDLNEVVLPEYVKRAMAWQTAHERRGPVVCADRQREWAPTPAASTASRTRRQPPVPVDGSRARRQESQQPVVRSLWDC